MPSRPLGNQPASDTVDVSTATDATGGSDADNTSGAGLPAASSPPGVIVAAGAGGQLSVAQPPPTLFLSSSDDIIRITKNITDEVVKAIEDVSNWMIATHRSGDFQTAIRQRLASTDLSDEERRILHPLAEIVRLENVVREKALQDPILGSSAVLEAFDEAWRGSNHDKPIRSSRFLRDHHAGWTMSTAYEWGWQHYAREHGGVIVDVNGTFRAKGRPPGDSSSIRSGGVFIRSRISRQFVGSYHTHPRQANVPPSMGDGIINLWVGANGDVEGVKVERRPNYIITGDTIWVVYPEGISGDLVVIPGIDRASLRTPNRKVSHMYVNFFSSSPADAHTP